MASSMTSLTLLVLAAGLAVVSADLHSSLRVSRLSVDERITPVLKPKSDNKFFKDDYPADARNSFKQPHFDYPYPAVQDHQDYDYDYVKDENQDNGEWKAHMAYDELRAKVHKEMMEMQLAKDEMGEAKEALDAARAKEQKAEDHAGITEVKVNDAEAHAADVAKDLDRVTDEVKNNHGSIAEARKLVEDDQMTLEECKKQLEKVRGDLAKLTDEAALAEKREAAAEAHRKELERTIAEEEKGLTVLKGESQKQLEELSVAKAHQAEEQKDVDEFHPELKKAIAKLNTFRDDADMNGGVYPANPPKEAPKAGAVGTLPTLMVLILALCGMLTA